jgi:L-amino acid N-acyltransferase YncA
MTAEHAAAVLAIYQAGIEEGSATFETRAPAWEVSVFPQTRPKSGSSRQPGREVADAPA